jgi:UDP-N-acetylglucosamine transferase subunit ALG13
MAQDLIVVSVGTDHHPFDRLVGWMDDWAGSHPEVRVVIQRGSSGPTAHAESHALISHGELCELFAEARAVVTHGGPSTVMDIRASGRLPIVFPRDPAHGEHVDGHQMRFGQHLARHRLARIAYSGDELANALSSAFESPDDFLVSTDSAPAVGVIAFGRVVDDLIGAVTPVVHGPGSSARDDVSDLSVSGSREEGRR